MDIILYTKPYIRAEWVWGITSWVLSLAVLLDIPRGCPSPSSEAASTHVQLWSRTIPSFCLHNWSPASHSLSSVYTVDCFYLCLIPSLFDYIVLSSTYFRQSSWFERSPIIWVLSYKVVQLQLNITWGCNWDTFFHWLLHMILPNIVEPHADSSVADCARLFMSCEAFVQLGMKDTHLIPLFTTEFAQYIYLSIEFIHQTGPSLKYPHMLFSFI